jgi:hypothetical protein
MRTEAYGITFCLNQKSNSNITQFIIPGFNIVFCRCENLLVDGRQKLCDQQFQDIHCCVWREKFHSQFCATHSIYPSYKLINANGTEKRKIINAKSKSHTQDLSSFLHSFWSSTDIISLFVRISKHGFALVLLYLLLSC